MALSLLLVGCQQRTAVDAPLGQKSFASYQQQTRAFVAAHRAFQTLDKNAELQLNTPQEWRPASPARKGILLIHGLGDGPARLWTLPLSWRNKVFWCARYCCRWHGTRPADLLNVSADQWREVVQEQADILAKEVDSLWVGGFSTGGNLALDYAMAHHDRVQGLLLFSPAFKVQHRV